MTVSLVGVNGWWARQEMASGMRARWAQRYEEAGRSFQDELAGLAGQESV
jgi:hypothetical protein